MEDYVSRTQMLENISSAERQGVLFRTWDTPAVIAFLEMQPSADVTPLEHSHWIPFRGGAIVQCNNCKRAFENRNEGRELSAFLDEYRFCPFCGAKME